MKHGKKRRRAWTSPVTLLAQHLTDRTGICGRSGRNRVLNDQIQALALGDPDAVRDFHVRKLEEVIRLLLVILPCAVLLAVLVSRNRTIEGGRLARPGYGESAHREELQARAEDGTRSMQLSVPARIYTEAEAQQLLEEGVKSLEASFLGVNPSEDEVRDSLYLPKNLEGGAVQISYTLIPYGMISEEGAVTGTPDEEGTLVRIQAQLVCQEQTAALEWAVRVLPPEVKPGEELWAQLQKNVQEVLEAGREDAFLFLPGEISGQRITWKRDGAGGIWLSAVLLLLPAALYIRRDESIREKARARQRELELDYPDLVWKLAMLIGAGMTIRGAFGRIAGEYRQRKDEKRYAYEELAYACYEMQSGVAESEAYERFGRRCSLGGYVKLGSVLAQNVRKGSRGLAEILEKEAAEAMEGRRSMARKIGEEAGTKMLFPMILMLGVVMVILMVPAFMTM